MNCAQRQSSFKTLFFYQVFDLFHEFLRTIICKTFVMKSNVAVLIKYNYCGRCSIVDYNGNRIRCFEKWNRKVFIS